MIGLIVLGLAFLFFVVVTFFAAKTWHVGHVVAMAFLFLFTLAFLFLTATLFRTHGEFRPRYTKAMQDIDREEQRVRSLTFGDPSVPAGEGTLVGERNLSRVEQATRGRVWRNVFGIVRPNQPAIILNMQRWSNDGCLKVGQEEDEEEIEPVADEELSGDGGTNAGDGEAIAPEFAGGDANPHGIVKDQLLYAFKEIPISLLTPAEKEYYFGGLGEGEDAFPNQDKRNSCRVPVAFLGQFLVQDVNQQGITVIPAAPLSAGQAQQLGNQAPWVLYEKLPTDTHAVFKDVDPGKLPNLIPLQRLTQTGVRIPQAVYDGMLNEYARDGKEFTGRVNNPFRLKIRVKFLRDYEEVVDLVVEGDLPPADRPFNVEGRAQLKELMQGESTKFAQGEEATFDGVTANRLIQQGIAERVGNPVYSRSLRNFEYLLRSRRNNINTVSAERKEVQSQVDSLDASLKRLQEQIDKHRQELTLLEEDRRGFVTERDELDDYKRLLEERLSILQGDVASLSQGRSKSLSLSFHQRQD